MSDPPSLNPDSASARLHLQAIPPAAPPPTAAPSTDRTPPETNPRLPPRLNLVPVPSGAPSGVGPGSSVGVQTGSNTCAVTAAPGYDVATVDKKEIDRLRRSRNPLDRAMAVTLSHAQQAYGEYIREGARVVVTRSPGNGGYPVLLLVGPRFDPSQPAIVHTHYHGFSTTVAEHIAEAGRGTARMRHVQQGSPQTVFVLPECKGAPTRFVAEDTPSFRTDWSGATDQVRTTADALAAGCITHVGERVVSAHSGGGQALANIIRRNPAGLAADRLELQDSFYGSERSIAAWASSANGTAVRDVVYVRGTNDAGRDDGVARAFGSTSGKSGGRYTFISVARDGQRNNPVLLDARGQPMTHKGKTLRLLRPHPLDPSRTDESGKGLHSRARGEFLHLENPRRYRPAPSAS